MYVPFGKAEWESKKNLNEKFWRVKKTSKVCTSKLSCYLIRSMSKCCSEWIVQVMEYINKASTHLAASSLLKTLTVLDAMHAIRGDT